MLPSILAKQLEEELADYIDTTFPMTNPVFRDSLTKMVRTKDAVFHEPYIAVRLPFRKAAADSFSFQSIHLRFAPWVHQVKAWERLSGDDGRSTLISTGTGSGKTECFLYPILEYCWNHRGESGIKALIIYPMNALASDQAGRIAKEIYSSPELRGNVTTGMYIGGYEKNPSTSMREDSIITDHETMLANPPDILLTNYKMLDYLLVRPKDAALWSKNGPESLKYIAVDELHTFDGAQGTDLACLLRRLKSRLFTQSGTICCIGTSATMGSKKSISKIHDYAEQVFGETSEPDSVIMEDRLSPEEFFKDSEITQFGFPDEAYLQKMQLKVETEDLPGYLRTAVHSWMGEDRTEEEVMSEDFRLELSGKLMQNSFFHSLLTEMNDSYWQESSLIEILKDHFPQLSDLRNPSAALDSLFALISHARCGEKGHLLPFLYVQTQVWIRELRRLLAKVAPRDITYALASDLNDDQLKQYLPVVNCRDCGETGWAAIVDANGNLKTGGLNTFYNLFFDGSDKIIMVFPHLHDDLPADLQPARLCPGCLHLVLGEPDDIHCPVCGKETFSVGFTSKVQTSNYQFVCPSCGSNRGIALIGLRSATAISACLSELFSSPFNDDKKTLAFSDNVQDAAHHAGFFNARTWRSGLRSTVQRYTVNGGDGLSLQDFSDGFINYWHEKLNDETYTSLFIAPNLTWFTAYEKMKRTGRFEHSQQSQLLRESIDKRLSYEIMLEYGMMGRIGRTLEKTGCSVLSFKPEQIKETAARVQNRTMNELGVLRDANPQVFIQMVAGFLQMMRINGAFNDPVFKDYLSEKGSTYNISNDWFSWLPGLRTGRNNPRFISENTYSGRRAFDFDSLSGNSKYNEWIRHCLPGPINLPNIESNISSVILEELRKEGIAVCVSDNPGRRIWGLSKKSAFISAHVNQYVCDTCGASISISDENGEFWEGAPCLRRKCLGHLHHHTDVKPDFFGKLYSSGDIQRIYAVEHTGLIEHETRKEIENEFKKSGPERSPWVPNLLSCTPTLEMGIDIGDLSTVILCSIPPSQSQYIQRAGRAGRKDGNALTVALVNARPHDLFFYTNPLEMISGSVEPPVVFLQAPAVLERQFMAYSMDCWIRSGVPDDVIPKHINYCLSKLDEKEKNFFPFNFLMFVHNRLSSLMRSFQQMFENKLEDNSIEHLKRYAFGDRLKESPMHLKILEAFENQKKQRDALTGNISELNKMIKKLESGPHDSTFDEQIKDLKNERGALARVVREINKKDIFNFLSDEGLLPNYEFPEDGVILKAILYRKEKAEADEGKKEPKKEKMVYEYNRSASSAITEFAPDNNFYVQGHKLKIDQIDLTTTQTEKWRLCPSCSHMEREEPGITAACCPICGSPAWKDTGQVRNLLKVQMVYSTMDYEKSAISDDSDDRSTVFYCRQTLVDVDEKNDVIQAFEMDNDEFPFGYEFAKKAVIREINFGPSDIMGDRMTVSGVEEVRKGFKICKYCGKIQPEKGKAVHTFTCKANDPKFISENSFQECLFLYRELETEALRILIPATTLDSTTIRQESFIAAFMLGMKSHFGNVDHLRACVSEEPISSAENSIRKQILVIYDSVPGGTGYLKQLMEKKNALIDVLNGALSVMENCQCKDDPAKDGCYHCLYNYSQSQKIGHISRKMAIRLVQQILKGQDNKTEISGLSKIHVNKLWESELERRFIEALDQMHTDRHPKLEISRSLVNGKEGYLLHIGDCLWEIEPQVTLGPADGVLIQSRPDFIFWPLKNTKNQKPVAVFTDGFAYHADISDDDSFKREAISRSNKYRVWGLSWKDVDIVFKQSEPYAFPVFDHQNLPTSKLYLPIVKKQHVEELNPEKETAMDLFLHYLENSDAERLFNGQAKAYAISLLNGTKFRDQASFDFWNKITSPILSIFNPFGQTFSADNSLTGIWFPSSVNSNELCITSGVDASQLQSLRENADFVVYSILNDTSLRNSDKFESAWNGWLQFFNLMQFLPGFKSVTTKGLDQHLYEIIAEKLEENSEENFIINSDWAEIFADIDD